MPRLCRVAGRDTWHVYHARRRISTGETDRSAAERFLADFKHELARPDPGAPLSVASLLPVYLADRRERMKPGADRLAAAHKPLTRILGTLPPDRIGEAESRAYARQRRVEGCADATTRTELQALRAATRWGHRQGMMPAPLGLELPPRPPARDRWLTRDEAARLVAGCSGEHVRLFVQVAIGTGARLSAILGLTWDRVDLDTRRIDFNEPGRARTTKGRARVPVNDTLAAALTAAKLRAETGHVIEWAGGPVAAVKTGFAAACRRAGLVGVSPHVLRHTAAVWMLQARIPVWEVAGMLGHTDTKMIEQVYGHHSPDFLADAARALG